METRPSSYASYASWDRRVHLIKAHAINLNFTLVLIAIYSVDDRPTHAARQLPTGRWTRKIPRDANIEHRLFGVNGFSVLRSS